MRRNKKGKQTIGRDVNQVLLISCSAPPLPSGSSAVLGNLLSTLPEHSVTVISSRDSLDRGGSRRPLEIPQKFVYLPKVSWAKGKLMGFRGLLVVMIVSSSLWHIWRDNCSHILFLYKDDSWMLSALLTSIISGRPLFPYVHDPYLEKKALRGGWRAGFSRWLENAIMQRCQTVVCLYPGITQNFEAKYDVHAAVIPHLTTSPFPTFKPRGSRAKFVIGFCGQIYYNNESLIRRLLRLYGTDPSYEIRIFTPHSYEELDSRGLIDRNVSIRFVQESQLDELLMDCDATFLPLAFPTTGRAKESLSLVLPTKLINYLRAQVPMVVHAPKDYEVIKFVEQCRCGIIVVEDSDDALKQAFEKIRSGGIDRAELRQSMLSALDLFSTERNAHKLGRILGISS